MVSGAQIGRAAVRCVVADGHPASLQGIAAVLAKEGFTVAGTAPNAEDAVILIRTTTPDVAVVDAAIVREAGAALARACPATALVVYTAHDEDEVRDALETGALAYVSKSQPLELLAGIVDIVAGGGSWVDPAAAPSLLARGAETAVSLTPREREVLALVADGRSYAQIAAALSITASTVQQHVGSAIDRLAAETRTQAVATALRLSLID